MKRHVGHLKSVAAAALLAGLAAVPATAQDIKLTYFTGPTGGSWIPMAGAIKSIWEKADKRLSIENRPGAGLVNMKAIEEGKAEIGMGNMISTVDALTVSAPVSPSPTSTSAISRISMRRCSRSRRGPIRASRRLPISRARALVRCRAAIPLRPLHLGSWTRPASATRA